MQNDLISRNAAMENYCNALCPKLQKGEYCHKCLVKSWLNNQPTAYDVDAVVEQLEKKKEQSYYDGTSKGRGNGKSIAYGQNIAYQDSINIVRNGEKG